MMSRIAQLWHTQSSVLDLARIASIMHMHAMLNQSLATSSCNPILVALQIQCETLGQVPCRGNGRHIGGPWPQSLGASIR
jgi:hypothetical protein